MNQDRIDGIIDIVSGKRVYDDIKYMMKEPIVNYGQAVVDSTLRKNVEFQGKSGLTPKVTRRTTGKACKSCAELAGSYEYPDVPKNVYQRHQNCRCIVEYDPGNGRKQNVHTKQWKNEENIGNRKTVGLETDLKKRPHEIIKKSIDGRERVLEIKTFIVDGIEYKVDGKHVVLDAVKNEKRIAEILSHYLEGTVYLVPRILKPEKISTPDFLINGRRYDLKSPTGVSKNVLYNMVSKKKKQANNFIFDVTNCPLTYSEILRQIDELYRSRHTSFIDEIILIKDGEVKDRFTRN